MKRALMISHTLNKGGMERQLSVFLNNYDRKKLYVTLALFKNEIQYSIPKDVEVIDLKKARGLSPFFAFRLIRLLSSKRYDVINCKLSSISFNIMLICAVLGKHNLIIEVRSAGRLLIPFFKRLKLLYKAFGRRWLVICNSKRAGKEARDNLPSAISIDYIPNGIDTGLFKREGLKNGDIFKIGFVGRILPLKDLKTLIEAFAIFKKKMPLSELFIVGSINDHLYYSSLQTRVTQLGLKEGVKFMEPIDAIQQFYSSLDLFILPSVYEGTPNVLLEAMSCETPCLVSRGANSDGILNDNFLFETSQSDDLVKKMLLIRNLSAQQRQELGKQNRNRIEKYYSIEKMVKQLSQSLIEKAG